MQKFISQIPELAHFLSQTHKKQHYKIIRQLILMGIETAQRRSYEQKPKTCDDLAVQIYRIKQNLSQLNNYVKHQCPPTYQNLYNPTNTLKQHRYQDFQYPQYHQKYLNPPLNCTNTERVHSQPAQKDHIEQKRTSEPKLCNKKTKKCSKDKQLDSHNPFLKQKTGFRHHLDDTQARQVLTYPADLLVQVHHPNKRKSKDYKPHIYQEQINKEQLKKIKFNESTEQHYDLTRRNRSQTDYQNAQSKIKSLLDKDRLKYMQQQRDQSFRQGFNKYQYSDENQMEEQSSFNQEARQINQSNKIDFNQSNFRQSNKASSNNKSKASSKKGIQRSKNEVISQVQVNYADQNYTSSKKNSQRDINMPMKMRQTIKEGKLYHSKEEQNQYDDQNDMISDSSSFSQFSINGSRRKEVGKISRRKQDN